MQTFCSLLVMDTMQLAKYPRVYIYVYVTLNNKVYFFIVFFLSCQFSFHLNQPLLTCTLLFCLCEMRVWSFGQPNSTMPMSHLKFLPDFDTIYRVFIRHAFKAVFLSWVYSPVFLSMGVKIGQASGPKPDKMYMHPSHFSQFMPFNCSQIIYRR